MQKVVVTNNGFFIFFNRVKNEFLSLGWDFCATFVGKSRDDFVVFLR